MKWIAQASEARALWRRLDRAGHDAVCLRPRDPGWRLSGVAAFLHESGPAAVVYSVDVDAAWRTTWASLRGFVGSRRCDIEIVRDEDAWRLNGVPVKSISHLADLDLSFTPATNVLQLKRAGPRIGETVSLPAAWFNLDDGALTELPQSYARLDDTRYRYAAPSVPYEGVLEVGGDGFIADYPGLWRREG